MLFYPYFRFFFENHKKLGEETYNMIAQKIGLKLEEFNNRSMIKKVKEKIKERL